MCIRDRHKILRKLDDPRIHFAINCASKSCPPLGNRILKEDNLDKQLDEKAVKFINSKEHVYVDDENKIISRIESKRADIANYNWIIDKPIIYKFKGEVKKELKNKIILETDYNAEKIEGTQFKDKVKFGTNVLVGKNVKIGSNCLIGHNSIIETNVSIGDNCTIGSNVIIRNSLIKNNVHILDGCIIGKKGFGFFPDKKANFRYPQIGVVIIEDNVEIGCSSTIDRGSLSNTVIGKNTFLDNQIHIAHNVKIGENCIIAGQVGFAGSSVIGNNVMIGGQAGISGHLKIGNNVQIGGGSGVIKDIPDNTKVMGYPAKNLKNFLRENK